MKKSFDTQELQLIVHCSSILRACPVVPFQLANKINGCKIAADGALKTIQGQLDLIAERLTKKNEKQCNEDKLAVLNNPVEIELTQLNEADFVTLDISGDKEVTQADGTVKKLSYRDAYFNLLGLIIL